MVAPGSGGVSGLVAVAGATSGFVAGARPGIAPAVLRGTVGAPEPAVLSRMVGAAVGRAMGPAVLRGMVGAGAGGAPGAVAEGTGTPGTVATGGRAIPTVGVGGLGAIGAVGGETGAVGGATGVIEADGEAGTSLALRVTRTVSFFNGMLEVCLDGLLVSSLMGLMVCESKETQNSPGCQTRKFIFVKFFSLNGIPRLTLLRACLKPPCARHRLLRFSASYRSPDNGNDKRWIFLKHRAFVR